MNILLKIFYSIILLYPVSGISNTLFNQVNPVVPLGHTDSIYASAFSKDGQLAFSLSLDQSLRVWEVASGREVKKYKMDSDHVKALAVSPNGYWVVTGDGNKGLKLWDVATGKKIQHFKGHQRQINTLDFSPDGKLLLSAGNDKKIRLWDIKTSKLIYEIRAHKKNINDVIFSPDGKSFASTSDDKFIIIWNTKTKKKIRKFKGHKKAILTLAYSPDGRYLLSAGLDKKIIKWDVKSGKKIKTYKGHDKAINSISFSPDQKSILSSSNDHSTRLWNSNNGQLILSFTGHNNEVLSSSFSPDGQFILSGSKDNTLRLWGTDKANQIRIFKGQASRLNAISVSPNGEYLFSAHDDRTLKLWDMKSGEALRIFSRHNKPVNDVVFGHKGIYAASSGLDNRIMVWNVNNGKRVRRFKGHRASVNQVLFTPSNTHILSASSDKSIRLWHIKKNRLIKKFQGHTRAVLAIAIHPKGDSFVSSSKDKTIRLWDIKSGQSKIIATTDYPVPNLKYTHDGQHIISSGWKLLKLDSTTGKEVLSFGDINNKHRSNITALSLSSDGKTLASGGYDNKINLWDIKSGKFKQTYTTPQGGILSLTFTPGMDQLISAGGDGVIRLWNLKSQQESIRMIGSNNGEWLTMTKDGYYNHSPEGNNLIHWVSKQGTHSYSFEQFEKQFKRPDIIKARLAGKSNFGSPPPNMSKPPQLLFSEHLQSKQVNANYIHLDLEVKDDIKIDLLRIYVNGRSVIEKSIQKKQRKLTIKVPLVSGANQITALSYNQSGLSSDPRYISVLSKSKSIEKPTLHILSVGVSKYQNLSKEEQLSYAHSDAQNFGDRFSKFSNPMYKEIKTHYFLNNEASKNTVLKKLEQLKSEVKENDILMVFFAGHGYKDTDKQLKETFYFATHDLIPKNISETAINWEQLNQKFKMIKGRILMFLDACHSGSISNQTVIPNNELAENLFNKEQGGIMVFSAAKGRQFAAESASFGTGEGLFSYAISKVLSQQGINADNNGNGYIELSEMVAHVQNYVDTASDGQQTPWLSHKELFGDIPISKVISNSSTLSHNIQADQLAPHTN